MSDTPRTDAAFARCIEEGGPYEPFHGPLIEESEALERELTQAQARCEELGGLLSRASAWVDDDSLNDELDAALKAQR